MNMRSKEDEIKQAFMFEHNQKLQELQSQITSLNQKIDGLLAEREELKTQNDDIVKKIQEIMLQ